MSDASPRIFRNLERTAGRDGFDTIVRAAVAAYAALRRPSERQARDFASLVMPIFEKTDRETRRILAASLATAPKLPRPLVDRLIQEPVAVAAPFLLGSPLLTAADVAVLRERADPPMARLLDARRPSTPAGEAPPATPTAKVSRAKTATAAPGGASRQTALMSIGDPETAHERIASSETAAAPRPTPALSRERDAAETRELLRRLAKTSIKRPVPADTVSSQTTDAPQSLVDLALRRDLPALRAALTQALRVEPTTAAAILEDQTAEPLAAALKALGTSLADAMTVLMMTVPRIGSDVAAFDAMQADYAALDAEDCAARFGLAAPPAVVPPVRHVPQYASDAASSPREGTRRHFGRRKPALLDTPAFTKRR
ncbi:hypothetical protein [Aureimonas psammosilenae]|uniref:hypothetical protein n=1 Tax=Aureimonas psammosilenae TaxID=2495496 RepID=UPI0012609CA2|nr:hypothetical protein [Aureimonas psammosilenae]